MRLLRVLYHHYTTHLLHWRVGLIVLPSLLLAVAVYADPFPPYWRVGSGPSVHFAPVA